MKVSIDSARCQGHGRCYDLAAEIFAADDEGYGQVQHHGVVAAAAEPDARLAEANCPEQAISIVEAH